MSTLITSRHQNANQTLALVGIGLEITSVASVLSAVFALSIAIESLMVYRRTEREHFLAFSIAFTLFAISYALLIPLAFGVGASAIGYENLGILAFPPRIVISTIGFVIIALSYTPTPRVRQLLYGLIALLIFLVVLVVVPAVPIIPYSVDSVLYLLHVGLLAYVLYRMWQVARPIGLVIWGFLVLLASQFVAIVATLQVNEATFLLEQALRVISLAMLFAAMVRASRLKVISKKQS